MALTIAIVLPYQEGRSQSLRADNMTVQRGQTNSVAIIMNSAGDINGMGFTLSFDTNLLSFVKQTVTVAVTDENDDPVSVSLNRNTNTPGRVGFGLAAASGYTFPAGSQTIVNVSSERPLV